MDIQAISASVSGFCPTVEVFDTVTSTNTVALERARTCALPWHTVISAHQSEGKGRLGRSFFSPAESGLYMSTVLYPDAQTIPLITGKAAVSAVRAIEDSFGISANIKWVNDIYINEKKVAGILAALNMELCRPCVILGIGFNIFAPDEGFPEELRDRAAPILPSYRPLAAERLAGSFLSNLHRLFPEDKNKEAAEEYRKKCITIGKQVEVRRLHTGDKIRSAHALDTDDSYRLLVEYEDKSREYLFSGEVSTSLKQCSS